MWARAERNYGYLRAGAVTGWQHVSFADSDDSFATFGADVAFDTRRDPLLPRNAVWLSASWEHVEYGAGGDVDRSRLEGRGYLGLWRQMTLELRAARRDSSDPVPPYFKYLLGGWSSLRGFKAGQYFGDETSMKNALPGFVTANARLRTGAASYLDLMLRWAGCLGDTPAQCRTPRRSTFAAKSDYLTKPMTAAAVRTVQRRLEQPGGSGIVIMDSYGGALRHTKGAFQHHRAICSVQELVYWSGRAAPGAKPFKQVVGAGRAVRFQDQAQHLAAQSRKADAARLAIAARGLVA